jgi:hypothetical protein
VRFHPARGVARFRPALLRPVTAQVAP